MPCPLQAILILALIYIVVHLISEEKKREVKE